MQNNGNLTITNMYLFEKNWAEVNDPQQRNYEFMADPGELRALENIMDRFQIRESNVALSEGVVAKKLPGLVGMSAMSTGGIHIPHGWNTRRLSFVIEATVQISAARTRLEYIQGYTDFFDPIQNLGSDDNLSRIIDPRTTFHVNSITTVNLVKSSSGKLAIGRGDRLNILKSHNKTSFEIEGADGLVKARPNDIVESLYFDVLTNNKGYSADDEINDEGITSDRMNSNSVSYFTDIFNQSILSSKTDQSDRKEGGAYDLGKLQDMTVGLATPELIEYTFMYALYLDRKEPKPSSFDLGFLYDIAPQLDEVSTLFLEEDVTQDDYLMKKVAYQDFDSSILTSNNLQSTLQPTIENLKSLELLHMMSSVMIDNLITRATLVISNDVTKVNQTIAELTAADSFFNKIFASEEAYIKLSAYAANIMLPKITEGNQIMVDAVLDIDLLNKSTISISVNAGDTELFRYNSSGDGLYSPHISSEAGKKAAGVDVLGIMDIVTNPI